MIPIVIGRMALATCLSVRSASRRRAPFCPTTPNEIKKLKLQCNTKPALCFSRNILLCAAQFHTLLLVDHLRIESPW